MATPTRGVPPSFTTTTTTTSTTALRGAPPATVHGGHASSVLAQRQLVMDVAYQQHQERFVKGPPRVPQLPRDVWINHAEDQTAYVG